MAKEKQLSPMMQHYLQTKEKYPDAILMYRLGDFYEMFFDDAKTASDFLGLTLMGRDCGLEERAPMCGVPYHAVDLYVRKLIEGGFKVAICEQLSDPKAGKGMVDRDVVRVITSGTVIEDDILEEKKSNYLMSLSAKDGKIGFAWADVSTGEFKLYEYKGENLSEIAEDFLVTVSPAEIIVNAEAKSLFDALNPTVKNTLPKAQLYVEYAYGDAYAEKALQKQLGVHSLEGFECKDKKRAISAAGALLEYVNDTQKRSLSHLSKIVYVRDNSFMFLDANTRRNLELTETIRERKKTGSILWLLDKTKTSMGGRNLRRWVSEPLLDPKLINARLDAVEELTANPQKIEEITEVLAKIHDMERLAGKVAYGTVNPKDCLSMSETLNVLPELKDAFSGLTSKFLTTNVRDVNLHKDVQKLLFAAIDEKAPAIVRDGGFIKKGYNRELDGYRSAGTESKIWLTNLEHNEKEATGIKNLKIGYNKVFGYYLEVSKGQTDLVPLRYQRKQTLTTGERYITEELKEIEEKILGAEEKALKLELMLFEGVKNTLFDEVPAFQKTARAIAELDAVVSLASVALKNNYVRPTINSKIKHIKIEGGRHPIVEQLQSDNQFVANDTVLDCSENKTMVITGPNMAGKSTYMRQVAVITLMAHIGSFVPAKSAEISLTDRIFTRVGASDDLISGQSTFMMEMIEVATILNNATENSLLILDEIGRGTSTIDGLSIAWAVIEKINTIGAKTLFATHFHELTELEGVLAGVKNYRILIKEIGGTVVFLHKIVRGGANKSFGIEVAALAGIPSDVVSRAKDIMQKLEEADVGRDTNSIMLGAATKNTSKQMSLFEVPEKESEIMGILKDLNMDGTTPLQAFAILMDLKEKAGK